MKPLYVQVKNWDKFQHYKSRDNAPHWIKMYPDLLQDYAFRGLPEADRCKLMSVWLLAGKLRNMIPYDAKYVAQVIGVKRIDLGAFVDSGWLELVDEAGDPVVLGDLDSVKRESRQPLDIEQSRVEKTERQRADDEPPVVVYALPASADIEIEVDRMLSHLAGCDDGSRRVLLSHARPLDLATVARIGLKAREDRDKGIGWAVNALKGALEERNAA